MSAPRTMRQRADADRIEAFLRALGRAAKTQTRVYLTGGATAVLEGWRGTTIDVDVRFEPEADELLREIPRLKERLSVNVELASRVDFLPELPQWRERSPFVRRDGRLDVHHFDPYTQALAKLERAFDQDLEDVREMVARGLVERERLRELHAAIEPELYRFPAVDPASFRERVGRFLAEP